MADQNPEPAGLHKYSCVLCHKRKVKCDRLEPCGYCVRHKDNCVYEAPPPPKRRKKNTQSDHADLLTRLQRAEDQLRLSGLMPPGPPEYTVSARPDAASSTTRPSSAGDGSLVADDRRNSGGRLISQGGSTRYIDNNLWVTLDNELQNPNELLGGGTHGGNERIGDVGSDDEETDHASGMLLGTSTITNGALADLFPQPQQQMVLWQVYIDNVHPLCMILHRPTFAKVVEAARTKGILSLPKNQVALLFSTYFFAAASLTNALCEAKLRETRKEVMKRLRSGTRHALVKAGFIRSCDLSTLQAFMQFLLCMRNEYDTQTLWVLSGAASKIGQRMGIHREDADAHLSPFEGEMRRRLWRQMLILDFTSSEMAGAAPFYTMMLGIGANSRIPLNVNDEDIHPDMKSLPQERFGATDMIFCRLRYEFGAFFLTLHKPNATPQTSTFDLSFQRLATTDTSISEKDQHINDLENKLQTQYLRFCDPINRLHNLTTVAARAAICGMRLRAHHPRQYEDGGKNIPQEERDLLFNLSIKIMKYSVHCHTQKDLQGYLWHVRVYFQWHAFIYLLTELRTRTLGEEVEKAWDLVEETFYYHPEIIKTSDFALYRAIRSIAVRAWDARENALRQQDMYIIVPTFISQIRSRLGADTSKKGAQAPTAQTPQSQSGGSTYSTNYGSYNSSTTASEAIIANNLAAGGRAMPFSVSWPQTLIPQTPQVAQEDVVELVKPGEPSPIDWDTWDSLVSNMDMPVLEFGMDSFFK